MGKIEGYIKRINHACITKHDEAGQKKIKKFYQVLGGVILGVGMGGFISSFITFLILFLDFKTDAAMIAWIVAVPFMLMIVAGSVLARVGDMLMRDFVESEYQEDKARKKELKEKRHEKKR